MYNRKSILKHSRVHGRKRKRFIGKVVLVIFSLGAILFSISYISGTAALTIQNVKVEGTTYVPTSLIETAVKGELQGRYVKFLSRANSLIYPKQKMENIITSSFPSVESVSISRSDFHTLLIKVVEQKPFALWCIDMTSSSRATDCYFMNRDGLIFAKADDASPDLFVYSGDTLKSKDPVGEHFLTSQVLNALSAFFGYLAPLQLKPVALVADSSGELELHTEEGPKLLLRAETSYDGVLQNLQSLLSDSTLGWREKGIPPTVEYIDLRFDNKVFYK